MDQIKKELIIACKKFVDDKFQTVETIMMSNKVALESETKSSAGDKHETGRAMLQLEMEKASLQLESANKMKETLAKINFHSISDISRLGSLVITSLGNYFLAISVGKVEISKKVYYAVSMSSPIGKHLLGTKVGDEIHFNEKLIIIKKVC